LAIQIWLLWMGHNRDIRWVWLLPFLFLFWINTHGGALAGVALLWLTVGATAFQFLVRKSRFFAQWFEGGTQSNVVQLFVVALASTGALFLNPWGDGLVRWLIGSVLWLRPEIAEWNPTRLSWEHGVYFAVAALTIISFLFSRKKRSLWEIAVCGALMVLAFRSVRHTPLFCIAALALVPRHLADVAARVASNSINFDAFKVRSVQSAVAIAFFLLSAGIIFAAGTLHKENPWTIEVPRKQYPVSAVEFIQKHSLKGNMLVFFDWGEMVLWELPECPPSIDGRLDTCYPRALISEHWKLYNGEPVNPEILNLQQADLALLPSNLAGAFALKETHGWQPIYVDDLAVVLVRDRQRFPQLTEMSLPVLWDKEAVLGRAAFPERNPRWNVE
ncbi:MAG: hypothetical protein ACK4UN_13650, partial [Limisphaerales bacterium]